MSTETETRTLRQIALELEQATAGDRSRCRECGEALADEPSHLGYNVTKDGRGGNCTWHGDSFGYYSQHVRGWRDDDRIEELTEELIAACKKQIMPGDEVKLPEDVPNLDLSQAGAVYVGSINLNGTGTLITEYLGVIPITVGQVPLDELERRDV